VENAVSWKGCHVNLVQKGKLGATPEAFAVGSPSFDPRFLLFTVLNKSERCTRSLPHLLRILLLLPHLECTDTRLGAMGSRSRVIRVV
jgi:hypothetical protein